MGYLKQFFRSVFNEGTLPIASGSFDNVSKENLEKHLSITRYDSFELTEAIRPSYDLQVIPKEGFRLDIFTDAWENYSVPVLLSAVSREKLFDTFIDLLNPLGGLVDVILESSHLQQKGEHIDYLRESIDLPVLKSVLYDYEELLINDGCTGIAILNSSIPLEIQFDEHKLLVVYGEDTDEAQAILGQRNVPQINTIRFLTEAEHVHSSRESYQRDFDQLKSRLGMERLI